MNSSLSRFLLQTCLIKINEKSIAHMAIFFFLFRDISLPLLLILQKTPFLFLQICTLFAFIFLAHNV